MKNTKISQLRLNHSFKHAFVRKQGDCFVLTFALRFDKTSRMEETIVITGASSGIGKACAQLLAAPGKRFILTARRYERLEALAAELTKAGAKVWIQSLDVRSREACQQWANQIPEAFRDIRVLVNNAGLAAGLSSIQDGDVSDWDQMIDTNVKGLLYVTEAILPFLKQSPSLSGPAFCL